MVSFLRPMLISAVVCGGATAIAIKAPAALVAQPTAKQIQILDKTDATWVIDSNRVLVGGKAITLTGYNGPTLASRCAAGQALAKKAISYLRYHMTVEDWRIRLEPGAPNAINHKGTLMFGGEPMAHRLAKHVLPAQPVKAVDVCVTDQQRQASAGLPDRI
ncbi:MAG: hypothetical protein AAF732_20530 [Pseudomonadota bacterium]